MTIIDLSENHRPSGEYPPACHAQPSRRPMPEGRAAVRPVLAGRNRPFRQLMAGEFIDGSPLRRPLRMDEVTGLALLYVQELDDQLVALAGAGGSRIRAGIDGFYNAVVEVAGCQSSLSEADSALLRAALRRANKLLYQMLAEIDHFAAAAR